MYHLIMAVLSIALMSAVTTAQVQYINPQAMVASEWQKRLENGLHELERGFRHYRKTNTLYETVDISPVEQATIENFYPPQTIADLRGYLTLPAMPEGLDWTFGAANNGFYFCLSGEFPPVVYRAALDLKRFYTDSPSGDLIAKYQVHNGCRATTSVTPDSRIMAVTFWVTHPVN